MNKEMTINVDLCIIGAGSAGLSLAAGAAMLGRNVVLIEKGEMGGDCLNTGCVPSKALIAAAERAHDMRTASKFGIANEAPTINFDAVMDHVHKVIATIAPIDSQERFEGLGVTVLRDAAAFTAPRQVTAGGTAVNAKHFAIATGSTPWVPPIPGLNTVPYFTNETIFENRILPDHLVVIGGGPIGVEMAQAFRRLGADVTIVEGDKILNKDDPELVEVVRKQLIEDGINFAEGSFVDSIEETGNGIRVVAGDKTIDGSHLLVAVGRRPSVNGLNLEMAGVDYSKNGITVNDYLQTSNKRIFAIGDVTGGRQFTHVAGYHASLLIRTILFKMRAKNNEAIAPWVTYCDPELAHVGLTEEDARARHGELTVKTWKLDENDRAQSERDTRGMIKVMAKKNGEVLGASIVGRGAGDLIQPWQYAIANGQKVKSFTNMISPYPTRGEISKRVAGAFFTDALFSDKTRKLVSLLSTFD